MPPRRRRNVQPPPVNHDSDASSQEGEIPEQPRRRGRPRIERRREQTPPEHEIPEPPLESEE